MTHSAIPTHPTDATGISVARGDHPSDRPWRSRTLVAILAVSFLLNSVGVNWGLPERWHPDELTQRAENMVGEPSLNPHFFVYGCFHHYLIAAFAVLPVKVPNKLLHLIDYERQTTLVVTLSRLLSALLGTGVVFLTFVIGDRLFDRRTGLFAAALLATSMLLVNLSHFATVDVPSLFWFMLSCTAAAYVLRGGGARAYVLAGLCAGLSAAVKYVGGLSLIALVAAHLLGAGTRHRFLIVGFLAAAFAFVLGNPPLLLAPLEFAEGFIAEMAFASSRGLGLQRAFLPLALQLRDALGLPALLLSCAGLAYAVRLLMSGANRSSVLLVFSMILPYYVVIGSMRGPRAGPLLGPLPPLRYLLPLLPFVLLFGAKLLSDLSLAGRLHLRRLAVGTFAVVLTYSFLYAAAVDVEFTNDSRYAAREWVIAHMPAGAVIETTSYGPTIPHDTYTVVQRPHDNIVGEIAAAVVDSDQRLRTAMVDARSWFQRLGVRLHDRPYASWYQKALARHATEIEAFDIGTQGLETRAPDLVVVSDLYTARFAGRADPEAAFFTALFSHETSYKKVAEFQYSLPFWLDPPAEFTNPRVSVFARASKGGQ